jgi:hypothetical protein
MAHNGAVTRKQEQHLAASRQDNNQGMEEHEYEAKASAKVIHLK